jgi:hypothetical protein
MTSCEQLTVKVGDVGAPAGGTDPDLSGANPAPDGAGSVTITWTAGAGRDPRPPVDPPVARPIVIAPSFTG